MKTPPYKIVKRGFCSLAGNFRAIVSQGGLTKTEIRIRPIYGILMRPSTVGLGSDMNNQKGSDRPETRLALVTSFTFNEL